MSNISKAPRLQVAICTTGRFQHFDLARQLERRGMLARIYSAYPRWKLRDEGLPADKITVFPCLQLLFLASGRLPVRSAWLEKELAWWAMDTLDRYVGQRLAECQVLVALACSGLYAGRLARQRGSHFVCDSGTSHIRLQDRLMKEEFSRWGQAHAGIDERILDKEDLEYSLADLVTVPSEYARKSFIEGGVPAEKIRKICYGVDLSRFRKLGEPDRRGFQALYVGAVGFRKGIPYLLQAFERLRHPCKHLVVAGAILPEMRAFLRDHPHLTAGVEFTGPLPQTELPGLMSRSHVLVLPSIDDGFGMVLAQAMACGCPIIGTPHCGAVDLVSESREGFVVPIRDSGAIAGRLEELASDPGLRARMSEAAMRRVTSMGGWQEYGDAFVEACEELDENASVCQPPESNAKHAQTRHP